MAQPFTPDGSNDALATPRNPLQSLSITAFARFEFEPSKGNEGTKILMIEWEDDDLTRPTAGSWHVEWDGKKSVLPADERMNEHTRRFYFLLPPGVTIPPTVSLTHEPPPESASTAKRPDTVQMTPLPAIFPPELGSSATQSGKKGVLHTIWAKKRLQSLEKEIQEEETYNLEGIALEMARQEKEWIEANFGIATKPPPLTLSSPSSGGPYHSGLPLSPASPRSPTSGRRLSEKLKGLKLGTSDKELASRPEASNPSLELDSHPLSPESPDVAVSSFSSFRNTPISAAAVARKKAVVAQNPPDFIQAQQVSSGMESLNFIGRQRSRETRDPEDELFAKPLSPRTPADARSPFSFSSQETMPYITRKLTAERTSS